jgi:hypothetical protein
MYIPCDRVETGEAKSDVVLKILLVKKTLTPSRQSNTYAKRTPGARSEHFP